MQTELKIQVPEGMEIDKENSTFEYIKFKPKSLTYKDIQKNYLINGKEYRTAVECPFLFCNKLKIYRQLLEVADYLNAGWKPSNLETTYYIKVYNNNLCVMPSICSYGLPGFKTPKLAWQAVDIIGKENLKLLFQ